MAKARPSRLRPLTLRLLSAPARAHHNALPGAEVCVLGPQSQWPKPGHHA
uniref:Uncharacterized protein n=1 Tax=Lacticaseibacillus rhamnosus TaxID=47715 RepID=A0A1Z1XG47_LACRH|nr:hypothetical protein [Lacticaseibacillus rhamnosus]